MRCRVVLFILCMAVGANFAMAQKMTVKDSDSNVLMEVNDEGTMGSIVLPDTNAALSSQTNKLYNLNGSLIWNGTTLGTAGSAGGWTDDGTVVRLSTITDKVGIGDSSPTHTLDVTGTIGINDSQIVYLPDQTNFEGTLIIGNGGGSLSNLDGDEGKFNTALGLGALYANTTGRDNTATGYYALNSNTTGFDNSATGYQALYYTTTGLQNVAHGARALYSNTSGASNTGIGTYALSMNTTGTNNTGIGALANIFNQEGSNNTIIGYEAGRGTSPHTKSGNIFIGYQAGYSEEGDNKLYIENSNSSTPLICGDFSLDEVYFNGGVGVHTTTPSAVFDVNGSTGYNQIRMRTSYTPANTADTNGNTGDIAWDDNYFYMKTSAGWKRSALSTF
jgi:hypothetical protein